VISLEALSVMRRVLFLVGALLFSASVHAQDRPFADTSSYQIEYTRVERINRNQNPLFGSEKNEINFDYVRLKNLTTGQAVEGVEVTLATTDKQVVGGSLALSSLGSIWGGSAGVVYRQINESGHIFLTANDLEKLLSFLDEVIGATGEEQKSVKIYKIALRNGFELGMMYDPDVVMTTRSASQVKQGWNFIVTAGGATYTLQYQDGIEILQKLTKWKDQIEENMQTTSATNR
jgi:hypothetical protein